MEDSGQTENSSNVPSWQKTIIVIVAILSFIGILLLMTNKIVPSI